MYRLYFLPQFNRLVMSVYTVEWIRNDVHHISNEYNEIEVS